MVSRLVALFALVSGLCAQTGVVFPTDLATAEGNGRIALPFCRWQIRYQQLEVEAKGRSFTFGSAEFRRDGVANGPTYNPLRIENLTIRVGDGEVAQFNKTFARNWVGSPRIVAHRQTFDLPAMSKPTFLPAPFAIRLPFQTAATHGGSHALLWEVEIPGTGQPYGYVYRYDTEHRGEIVTIGLTLLPACRNPSGFQFLYSGSLGFSTKRTAFTLGGGYGYPNAHQFALIGFSDPNLRIPGLCAPLRATPDLMVPLGRADALGHAWVRVEFEPWKPAWAGAKLHSQLVSVDPSLGILLSFGAVHTAPAQGPRRSAQFALWNGWPTSATGKLLEGGLVVRFR